MLTPREMANIGFKEAIIDYLIDGKSCTVADMIENIRDLEDMTYSFVAPVVNRLIADGTVECTQADKKKYYSLA